jgi:hypothetical protein
VNSGSARGGLPSLVPPSSSPGRRVVPRRYGWVADLRSGMTSDRFPVRNALIVLLGIVLFVGWVFIVVNYDAPSVIDCTDRPVISVDVSPNRAGRLVKRELLGCDWYWWDGVAARDSGD